MSVKTRRLHGAGVAGVLLLAACGGAPSNPTPAGTPIVVVASPTPSATPTPSQSVVLPAGMVCPAPTPPPMLRLNVKVHGQEGNRIILDSKPIVPNVDGYCDKVGFGDWKFCDTRPEGNPERTACDYLAVGKADNGRFGPTWYYEDRPCGSDPEACANHPSEQFMAVAKKNGSYVACASDSVRVAENGSRCGVYDLDWAQ